MLTQCPQCETIFRVSQRHLAAAKGKVRCGNCKTVFNAKQESVKSRKDLKKPTQSDKPVIPRSPRPHELLTTAISSNNEQQHIHAHNENMFSESNEFVIRKPDSVASAKTKAEKKSSFEQHVVVKPESPPTKPKSKSEALQMGDSSILEFEATPGKTSIQQQPKKPKRTSNTNLAAKISINNTDSVNASNNSISTKEAASFLSHKTIAETPSKTVAKPELNDALVLKALIAKKKSLQTKQNSVKKTATLTKDHAKTKNKTDKKNTKINQKKQKRPDKKNLAQSSNKKKKSVIEEIELKPVDQLTPLFAKDNSKVNDTELISTEDNNAEVKDKEINIHMDTVDIPYVLRNSLDELDLPKRSLGKTLFMLLSMLILSGILILQTLVFKNVQLAQNYPQLSRVIKITCGLFPCRYTGPRDIKKIQLISRDIRIHPNTNGALLVTATFISKTSFQQPYPNVRVTLSNLAGNIVARRYFSPIDYLGRRSNKFRLMPPGLPVKIALEVVDPGKDAINFDFSILAAE